MKRSPSISVLLSLVFLTLGITLRLWYYLDARSLFIDEANLALNISELPYHRFFQPLLYDQYAPPLFMVFSKGAVQLLGNHEWALRLWPLIGGILILFTFLRLNKKLHLATAICWFPLAMAALSPFLLRFATELKQYSTDGALALGIILLALELPPEKMKNRHYWIWAFAGALSLWLSMPVVFLLCGVGTYYFYHFIRQRNGKALFVLSLVGAVWALSFAVLYITVLKAGIDRPVLQTYHSAYFFPVQLWETGAWKQLGGIFYGLLSPALGFTVAGLIIGIGLLLWGSYRLFQQQTGFFILIVLPILACFSAAACQLFSLIPRVSLFLMPLFLMLATYGASEVWKSSGTYLRMALLGLLILEAAPFANSINQLGQTTEIENLKAVLVEIKGSSRPGPAYIDVAATPAYRYYSQWHDQKQRYQFPGAILLSWDSNLQEILERQRQESPGFWLVFSQLLSGEARDLRNRKRSIAEAEAEEKVQIEKTGAEGYWYEYKGS